MAKQSSSASARVARMRAVLPADVGELPDQPSIIVTPRALLGTNGTLSWSSSVFNVERLGVGIPGSRNAGFINFHADRVGGPHNGTLHLNLSKSCGWALYFECIIKKPGQSDEVWWSVGGGPDIRREKANYDDTLRIAYFGSGYLASDAMPFAVWLSNPSTDALRIWRLDRISIYLVRRR